MNHWSAELNHNFNPPWVLRFDPTPGGKRNDDGTTSWSMTFPAIQFTEWVSEPEKEANKLAETLNTHASQASRIAELEKALRGILSAETHDLHVGYDSGSGGGNYVYADVVRTDDEAFIAARKILGDTP